MAIVLMESFDKYPTGQGAWVVNGWNMTGNNGSLTTTNPRTGTRCIESRQQDFYKDGMPALGELIYGSGWRMNAAGAGNHLSFREIASGVNHVQLAVDATMHLIAKHGSGSPVYGTSALAFATSAWYWIEVRLKVHDTLGTLEIRVNGDPWIGPLTGLDTRNGGTGLVDRLYYVCPFFNAGLNIDDVIVIDPSTGTPNNFIGDSRVEMILPNANGSYSAWVGSDGNSVDNYALVDEVPHNSDTDYVQSNVVGDKDAYNFPSISMASGTVHAVKTTVVARKNSAGTRKFTHLSRLSGTDVESAEFNLPDSYIYTEDIRHTKPGGGSWAIADVNAAEFGVKVSS